MNVENLFNLLVSLIPPIGLGSIAAVFTAEGMPQWFDTLNKPSFNLPTYLFGPVWTALYALMGVSMFLNWNTPKTELRQKALTVFGAQLVFNF